MTPASPPTSSASSTSPASSHPPGWSVDFAYGLGIAGLVLLLLIFSASPFRADRGFIYIDF